MRFAAKTKNHTAVTELAKRFDYQTRYAADSGIDVMKTAAQSLDLDTVIALCNGGFDINHPLSGGKNALMLGLDTPFFIINKKSKFSNAPTMDELEQFFTSLVKLGANNKAVSENGDTALIIAAKYKYAQTAKALAATEGDVNAVDNNGRTALRLALASGHQPTIDALRAARAK